MLKEVDPKIVKEFVKDKKDLIFMNNFPVTPNSHRVNEFGGKVRFVSKSVIFVNKILEF